MSKAPVKKAPVKKTPVKKAPSKKAPVKKAPVAPKVVKPEIPILMRPSESKLKKAKKHKKFMNPLEVLFHTNSTSAVGIAFINALNGGLVVVTMLLMTIAFVTEMFVIVMRDYSEATDIITKYKNIIKSKVKRK